MPRNRTASKTAPKPLVHNGNLPRVKGPVFLDEKDLEDAREEIFVRMVADGLPIGTAFERAGFKSANSMAATRLFRLPRIQARIEAVLYARRTTGVVTLPEVTDMLKRVYAGATSREEYNAAHNAAFSLARLYGHVTDRATVEVLRRPSRDPDAPAEQALGAWVENLPGPVIEATAIEGPGPEGPDGPSNSAAMPDARGPITEGPGLGPVDWLNENPKSLLGPEEMNQGPKPDVGLVLGSSLGSQGPGPEKLNDFNDLQGLNKASGPGQSGNGAPTRPVTGAPKTGARSRLLRKGLKKPRPHPGARASKKRVPSKAKRVPPPMGDLF